MFGRSAAAIAMILITTIGALATAIAQEETTETPDGVPHSVGVAVRPLENGMIEFAVLRLSEQILPEARYLDVVSAPRNRWLNSSPVTLLGTPFSSTTMWSLQDGELVEAAELYQDEDDAWNRTGFGRVQFQVSVTVQVHRNGYLEFAIIHRGERVLPEIRWLSPETRADRVGEWLSSSEVDVYEDHSPASLVRDLSNASAETANVDVAQYCVLAAVEEHGPPRYQFYNRFRVPETHPEFKNYISATGGANDASVDATWL